MGKVKNFFTNMFKEYMLVFGKINTEKTSIKEGVSCLLTRYSDFVKDNKEFNPKNDYFSYIYNEKLKSSISEHKPLKITGFRQDLLPRMILLTIELLSYGIETFITKTTSKKIIFNPVDYTDADLAKVKNNILDTIGKDDKAYLEKVAKKQVKQQIKEENKKAKEAAMLDIKVAPTPVPTPTPVAPTPAVKETPVAQKPVMKAPVEDIIDTDMLNQSEPTDQYEDFDDVMDTPSLDREEFEPDQNDDYGYEDTEVDDQDNEPEDSTTSDSDEDYDQSFMDDFESQFADDHDQDMDSDETSHDQEPDQGESDDDQEQSEELDLKAPNFDFGNSTIQPIENKYDNTNNRK